MSDPLSTTGISTDIVKAALGYTTTGTAVNLSSLCKDGNINMWSKWKPISAPYVTVDASILQNYKWGITVPTYNDIGDYAKATDAIWTYDRPTGGETSPYRLGDFRSYFHSAYQPARLLMPLSEVKIGNNTLIKLILNIDAGTNNAYNVKLYDPIYSTSADLYFAVVVANAAGAAYCATCNDSNIKTGTTVYSVSLQSCPLISGGSDGDALRIRGFLTPHKTGTSTAVWTDVHEYTFYSLEQDEGVSFADITLSTEGTSVSDVYNCSIMTYDDTTSQNHDYKCFGYSGNGALASDYVTRTATMTRKPDNDPYTLFGVDIYANFYDSSADSWTNYGPFTGSTTGADPASLETGDLIVPASIGLRVKWVNVTASLPTKSAGDYFVYTYKMKYKK